jgi:hypothetical protein
MGQPADQLPPQWYVLVDETMGGYLGRKLTHVMPADGQEAAVATAERTAFTYMPRHPSSPKSRSVFRTGPNTWVVQVMGATATFHFTVTIGTWVGTVEH